ncbi:6660_t:CDS:2 [Cetraspora pellucida]|uniref:6660_t:CDS:1 n=1 Tax=Cetraspora pellucida TaxID=1433469 RepID=A0ACA9K960_9GLOM|nr:6660_t:CDS:2 [Cetraspora pellucida]
MTTTTTSLPKHVKNLEGTQTTLTTLSLEQASYDDKGLIKSPQEMNCSSLKEDENAKDENAKDENAMDENTKDENVKDENQNSNLDRKTTIDKKLSAAVTEAMKADDVKVATKIENNGELVVKNDFNMSEITKYQIVAVMESLTNVPEEDITCTVVQTFVTRSAVYLGDYKILKYGETTAELELHLKAMSAVVHVASRSISMLEQETRERLYKSMAKFWDASQRTSAKINPNITFYLREIRCCLKKIKDDQTKLEYALACAVKSFSFEYPAGEWYDKWRVILEEFHGLKQNPEGYSEFWTKLYNIAREEFKQIRGRRATIAVKNVKYKVLKRGSGVFLCSLPDNVDTLLIGYLILMERLVIEFPQSSESKNNYSITLLEFCQEILDADVKKQLSAKAVEVLLIIQELVDVVHGSKIEDLLNTWGMGKGKQQLILDQIKILKEDRKKILKTIETARADYEKDKLRQQSYNVPTTYNIEQKVEIGSHVETQNITNIENIDTKIEKVETMNVENTTIESQFIENIENKIDVENQYVENIETKVETKIENVNVNVEKSVDVENQLVENIDNIENLENVERVENTQYIGTQNVENVKGTNTKIKNINVVEELDSQNLCVETIETVQTININNYETKNINEIKNINETNNTTNVENINNEIISEVTHEMIVQSTIIQQVVQPEEKRQSHWLDNVVAVIKDVEKRVLGVDGSNRRSILFPNHDDNGKRMSMLFSNNDDEAKRMSTLSTNNEANRESILSTSDDEAKRKSILSSSDDEAKRKSTSLSDDEAKSTVLSNNNDDKANGKSVSLPDNEEVANNSTVKDESN